MAHSENKTSGSRLPKKADANGLSDFTPEHYLRIILHRKWLVLIVFLVVSATTFVVTSRLPNIYTSETLILVDPQKVPEAYVKATVSGDIQNRLGTLSQQILSATRLQKIIETHNLYPEERKTWAREDVIMKMRKDVNVSIVSNFGATGDLQAFRISYSGEDPRLVARVTNELASLFIEENLKDREQQATGTTEFLGSQLEETLRDLETQEAKLKDFRQRHVGELPEQQAANLQMLGQLESQLQLETQALHSAEQNKNTIQAMMVQSAPVVDMDDGRRAGPAALITPTSAAKALPSPAKLALATARAKYTEDHPDVRRLRKQVEEEEAKAAKAAEVAAAEAAAAAAAEEAAAKPADAPTDRQAAAPANFNNPILQTQLASLNAEIARHKDQVQRLTRSAAAARGSIQNIPLREQEMTKLVRDYETAKAHYTQLRENQMSAQTATQLEIRMKAEKFRVLDQGQPAERPSRPNRALINSVGSVAGLVLGVLLAIGTQFLGLSITSADDVTAATGLPVLEVIPVIATQMDRRIRRRRLFVALATGVVGSLAVVAVVFLQTQS